MNARTLFAAIYLYIRLYKILLNSRFDDSCEIKYRAKNLELRNSFCFEQKF